MIDSRIQEFYAYSVDEVIRYALQINKTKEANLLYFRGENTDHGSGALTPSIYRQDFLKNEHQIFREMQRFNDNEFTTDKTAFDKLARMQHYTTPTRMLDLSEDIFSSLYFSLDSRKENTQSVLYILEIEQEKIKYYDSDSVSILANLAKSPLEKLTNINKSKQAIHRDALQYINDRTGYNQAKLESKEFLLHDIKEEKSYFNDLIDPVDIFSILAVKPKLNSQRLQKQKGAFLLFGLNKDNYQESFKIINEKKELNPDSKYHPIVKLTKIIIAPTIKLSDLATLGITKPFIYPELDRVSEYLKDIYTS